MTAPLAILAVFAVLVALYGSFRFGQASATVRLARRFDAQGRWRLP